MKTYIPSFQPDNICKGAHLLTFGSIHK